MNVVLALCAALLAAYVDAATTPLLITITPTATGWDVLIGSSTTPVSCTDSASITTAVNNYMTSNSLSSSSTTYSTSITKSDGTTWKSWQSSSQSDFSSSMDMETKSYSSSFSSSTSSKSSSSSSSSSSSTSGSSGEGGKSGGKGKKWGHMKVKCFAADSSVMTQNGPMTMAQLFKAGEANILTANGQFSPLKSWIHANEEMEVEFNQITTTEGILKATDGHLIYKEGKQAINAGKVQVGDRLLNAQMEAVQVLKIEKIRSIGFYAPLTESGDLVVEGHFVSSYSEIEAPMLQSVMFQYVQNMANILPNRISNFLINSQSAEAVIGFFELGQKFMA